MWQHNTNVNSNMRLYVNMIFKVQFKLQLSRLYIKPWTNEYKLSMNTTWWEQTNTTKRTPPHDVLFVLCWTWDGVLLAKKGGGRRIHLQMVTSHKLQQLLLSVPILLLCTGRNSSALRFSLSRRQGDPCNPIWSQQHQTTTAKFSLSRTQHDCYKHT